MAPTGKAGTGAHSPATEVWHVRARSQLETVWRLHGEALVLGCCEAQRHAATALQSQSGLPP
jgi:hypothetical protein